MAERVGFEPTVPLLVHELSKLARSATLTPLLNWAFLLFFCSVNSEGVLRTDTSLDLQPFLSEGMQKYQISVNIAAFYKF